MCIWAMPLIIIQLMRSFKLITKFCTRNSPVTIPAVLAPSDNLLPRHIGPSPEETREMLRFVEAASLEDLMKQTISNKIVDTKSLAERE